MPPELNRSAAAPGGRARAGNGMSRARGGILAGAATCVTRYGTRKTTMGDIAREGGVAKATLYNHFRAKDEVLSALVAAEVDRLVATVESLPGQPGTSESVVEALVAAACFVSDHAVIRALAGTEPAVVAGLVAPGESDAAKRAVGLARERLSLAQAAGGLHPQHDTAALVDLAVRWVLSHAWSPARPEQVRVAAELLVHGLVTSPHTASTAHVDEAASAPADPAWSSGGLAAG